MWKWLKGLFKAPLDEDDDFEYQACFKNNEKSPVTDVKITEYLYESVCTERDRLKIEVENYRNQENERLMKAFESESLDSDKRAEERQEQRAKDKQENKLREVNYALYIGAVRLRAAALARSEVKTSSADEHYLAEAFNLMNKSGYLSHELADLMPYAQRKIS